MSYPIISCPANYLRSVIASEAKQSPSLCDCFASRHASLAASAFRNDKYLTGHDITGSLRRAPTLRLSI
ncbi:hypothetical protein [Phormidium nigroviride]